LLLKCKVKKSKKKIGSPWKIICKKTRYSDLKNNRSSLWYVI